MSRIREYPWPFAVGLAALLLAAPLWCVAMPGMPDYPAHLASFALIAGEPSRFYTVHWAALPNLASELLVPIFAKVMPLETAARLFLTATVILWAAGPALIQRALFGRIGPGAIFAAIFAYNANFIWGFFNYTFAVGLAFVVFALWIATEGRRSAAQLALFAIAFTAIYLSHLFGLAVLLLAIGGYELSGLIDDRFAQSAWVSRVLQPALLCVPAALAFLLKPAAAGGAKFAFDLLDTFQDRFEAAIQIGFDKPVLPLTIALILVFALSVATRRIAIHPRMRIALTLFGIGVLIAPEWAAGGWGVHMRLPAVAGALAFASTEWTLPSRVQRAGGAIAMAILAAGSTFLATDWRFYDARYAEFRGHEREIAQNARVLTVLDGDSLGWSADQPYWHMAEFAIIDRGAFTPLMFTTRGQHIVHALAPFDRIAAATAQQGSPPDIDELDDLASGRMDADEDYQSDMPYLKHFQCNFDEAIVIRGAGPYSRTPSMLRRRASGSFYTLYDIVPDRNCGAR